MTTREPRTVSSTIGLQQNRQVLFHTNIICNQGSGLIGTMFLTSILLLATRSFIVSPIFEIVALGEQLWLLMLVLFLGYLVTIGFATQRYTLDAFELVMVLLGALPILAAIASHIEYDQPLVHGVVAFKDYYLLFTALFVYYLLKRGLISIRQLELALAWASVVSLVLFYGLSLFTNPAKYADTIIAGSQSTKGGGIYYRFNMGLIFYGAIYYFIKAIRTGRLIPLITSGLFVAYILFFRLDRTSMVACVVALALAWLLVASRSYKVRSMLYYGVPGVLGALLVFTAFPSIVDAMSLMFWDAISTLLGENNGAGQALLRNYEAGIVMEQIQEHPIIGNGRVSNTWVEGAFDHFYRFFYPSDVGFLGTLFMFGAVGTIMLYSQYALVVFTAWHMHWEQAGDFAIALLFYLLILFLDSLSNGSLVIYSCQTVIAVMALFYLSAAARHEVGVD